MKNDGMDSKLKNAFNDLHMVPPRDPQVAARGRANFLKEGAVFRQSLSMEADRRSNSLFPLFQRNQRKSVLNPLIAVVLAAIILFGGSGITVFAAQGSLPDQGLYPLKTWSEDVILSMVGSPQVRLNYALDFSDRRVAEISGLLAIEKPIPEGVDTRLQNELDLVLQLTAVMNDAQAIQQLERVRQRAEAQYKKTTMLISGAPETAEPLLLKAHEYLQEQIRLATMGETDLQGFRVQIRQHIQNRGGSGEETPGSGNGHQGPGPMRPTDTPPLSGTATDNGHDPVNPIKTPVPSSTGYGSGPGINQPTGDPGQYGSQYQQQNQTPQSSGGYGHGP
jgi:hypothetical protein